MALFFLLATLIRGPADVESLAAVSDAVVRAQVTSRASSWSRGGGLITTTVVLHTLEAWKGAPGEQVTLVVEGGSVGEWTQSVSGGAQFADGEEVVVFLRRRAPGIFALERMALGKFAVGAPGGLPRRAVRDRRGLDCLGCGPAESDDLSLDELRARVLRSVQR
jgi:hypothetical protein